MALTSLLLSSAVKNAGSFLFAKWKWIAVSVVIAVVLYGVWQMYNIYKDREFLLKEREGTIAQLVQDNTEAELELQSRDATIEKMLADRERTDELHAATIKLYEAIYEEVASQKQIFEDHDFTKLSNAKPGLIITPMNDATKERFDEISSTFND